jgi:hypothetical protein
MPFTSTQVSGLVGGQQVMFANQATFANQIGGGSGAMMANPYPSPSYGVAGLDPGSPDIGTKLAGGIASSLPITAGIGASIAGMAGYNSSLGRLDPFTGVSRAFGAGTGSVAGRAGIMAGGEGLGLAASWSNVSGAFAQGGMRAGFSALGGGLAGAASAAVPYYLGAKAIEATAGQMYEGVQNFQDTRRMTSQYFSPQYGQPGATLGGRSAGGMIKEVTSIMHEMASEDAMAGMRDLRRLMDKAGSMGMLQGVGDVNQFKERFKGIISRTKAVAQILGTTLDEAMPIVNQLQQMGTWTAKDVLGAAVAAKVAGPGGAQALAGSMQQGAQMSYQMGGRLESGAALGQQLFGQVSAATRSGVFSENDIRNMTGGTGGAEGQRMVAGTVQQVMSGMGQTAMGRLMMAGMGEVKGNEFTGRMDDALLKKFQRGEISIEELQQRGKQRINSSKDLATSFFNRADTMGQSMAEQGGIAGMAQGIKQAMTHAGYGGASDSIQNRFIQMLTGSNQKQADVIQQMIKNLPKIQAEQERASAAALEDSFRQIDERRNRSLTGLKEAIGQSIHEAVGRPFQELGENMAATMGDSIQRFTDKIRGRTRSMPRIGLERGLALAQGGALSGKGPQSWEDLGARNVGQSFVDQNWLSNMSARAREGSGGGLAASMAGGAVVGGVALGGATLGLGAIAGAAIGGVVGGGLYLSGLTESESPQARALMAAGLETSGDGSGIAIGKGRYASRTDVERVARKAVTRSIDATMGGLLGGESPKKREAMEKVKARLREMFTTTKYGSELAELRKKDPEKYRDRVLAMLKEGPGVQEAMNALGGGKTEADLDILAVGQKEQGLSDSAHAVGFDKQASAIAGMPTSPEEVTAMRDKAVASMTSAASSGFWSRGGVTKTDIESIITSKEYSIRDILKTAEGGTSAFGNAAAGGKDASAAKVLKFLQDKSISKEKKDQFIQALKGQGGIEQVQFIEQTRDKLKEVAKGQGPISSVSGVKSTTLAGGLEEARLAFEKGDLASGSRQLELVAGSEKLSTRERKRLLGGSGGGGEMGKQVGRLSLIGSMGEMGKEGWDKFTRTMDIGGVSLATPEIKKRVEEMLKSGGKIEGAEISELQDMLKKTAGGATGQGAGTEKTAAEKAQIEYIQANTKFVEAVSKALGKEIEAPKELTNPNQPQTTTVH